MCGFLTSEEFLPTTNIAENPLKSFKIDSINYAKNYAKTIAIVHSHTRDVDKQVFLDPRTPSYSDYVNQKKTGKPWLIVESEGISVSQPLQFPRVPSNIYIGRQFQWFISDCYNLVQDYYKFELGIELPDAVIKPEYNAIRLHNHIFAEYIESYGFKEVHFMDITTNDLVLINKDGFQGNHLGVYIDGDILHQDLLSVRVPFETFIGRTAKVLRYVKTS